MVSQSLPSSCCEHGGGFSLPSRIASSKVIPYAARLSLSIRCFVFRAWASRSLILSFSFTKISSYSCQRPEDVLYCLRYLVVLSRGVMGCPLLPPEAARFLLFLSPGYGRMWAKGGVFECIQKRISLSTGIIIMVNMRNLHFVHYANML